MKESTTLLMTSSLVRRFLVGCPLAHVRVSTFSGAGSLQQQRRLSSNAGPEMLKLCYKTGHRTSD